MFLSVSIIEPIKILEKCAVEHPHHTLPILFALKNSDKDRVILNASGAAGSSTPGLRPQEPRTAAAEALVKTLAATNTDMKKIIEQMEKFCDGTCISSKICLYRNNTLFISGLRNRT